MNMEHPRPVRPLRTLYETYNYNMARLIDLGHIEVVEMAKRFTNVKDMAAALGYEESGSACGHWLRGAGLPGRPASARMRAWLKDNPVFNPEPEPEPERLQPDREPVAAQSSIWEEDFTEVIIPDLFTTQADPEPGPEAPEAPPAALTKREKIAMYAMGGMLARDSWSHTQEGVHRRMAESAVRFTDALLEALK